MTRMTAREKAYRLVERDLRKLDINEVYVWRDRFWLADGSACDVTIHQRGDERDYTAGGVGLMEAVDMERRRQRAKRAG